MSDLELVNSIKQNIDAEESINELLVKHGGLITDISSRFTKLLNDSGSSIEELNRERAFIVYKAATTYKEGKKTKFSTYLASYVRWYCLNKINKSDDWKHVGEENLDNVSIEKKDETALEYIRHLLDRFEDPKIKKVFELRYFSGPKLMSWGSIGEIMGVSGQAVNNWHGRSLKLLRNRAKSDYDL